MARVYFSSVTLKSFVKGKNAKEIRQKEKTHQGRVDGEEVPGSRGIATKDSQKSGEIPQGEEGRRVVCKVLCL